MADSSGIRAGRAYVELGTSDKLTAGLNRAQRQLQTFAATTRKVGLAMTGAFAGAAVPAALALKAFASFDQSMARVRALSGATGVQFAALSQEAQRLGRETVYTATDAANAMARFAQAGFSVDHILKATGPTLDMASAGLLGIEESADIATKIMKDMGVPVERLAWATDILTKAMVTSNTDFRQLGDAMKYVGPVAREAGLSLETTVAAIQMLSNAGIVADMAGTTIRGALLSLTQPSKEAADELAKLGVRVNDEKGNFRPLADIIDEMNQGLKGMGTGERLGAIGKIFDNRQAAGFATLLHQGGNELRRMTEALTNSKGTASTIAGIQLDTLRGDMVILQSAAEGLSISLGSVLAPVLRTLAIDATGVVNALSKWTMAHGPLIRQVALAVSLVGGLGVGLLGLSVAGKVASVAFGGLAMVVGPALQLLKFVPVAIAAIASPVGSLTAALAVGGAALIAYSGTGTKALRWLKDTFWSVLGSVQEVLGLVSEALAAGEFRLAAKVLWLGLKVEFEKGGMELNLSWTNVWETMGKTVNTFSSLFAVGIIEVFAEIRRAQIGLAGWMADSWSSLSAVVLNEYYKIAHLAEKVAIQVRAAGARMAGYPEYDTEQANLENDERLRQRKLAVDVSRGDERSAIAAETQRQHQENAARNDAELMKVGAIHDRVAAEIDARGRAAIAQTRKDLDAAKAELNDALAKARERQAVKDQGRLPDDPFAGKPGLFEDISRTLAGKISQAGTFNAAGAVGLGAANVLASRTAKATEQTAEHTKTIAKWVQRTAGLSFS